HRRAACTAPGERPPARHGALAGRLRAARARGARVVPGLRARPRLALHLASLRLLRVLPRRWIGVRLGVGRRRVALWRVTAGRTVSARPVPRGRSRVALWRVTAGRTVS